MLLYVFGLNSHHFQINNRLSCYYRFPINFSLRFLLRYYNLILSPEIQPITSRPSQNWFTSLTRAASFCSLFGLAFCLVCLPPFSAPFLKTLILFIILHGLHDHEDLRSLSLTFIRSPACAVAFVTLPF